MPGLPQDQHAKCQQKKEMIGKLFNDMVCIYNHLKKIQSNQFTQEEIPKLNKIMIESLKYMSRDQHI